MTDTPTNHPSQPGPGERNSDGARYADGTRLVDDDEISLVDLLVVLIRRRRLVIGLPLLAGLVAGVVLFVLPLLSSDDAVPGLSYDVSLSAELRQVPTDVQETLNFDSVTNAHAVLKDINVVGGSYAAVFPERADERARYNTELRQEVMGEKLNVEYDTTTGLMTLRYTSADPDASLEFLQRLMTAARDILRVRLVRRIDDVQAGLERSLETRREQLVGAVAVGLRTSAGNTAMNEANIARLVADSAAFNISVFAAVQDELQKIELLRADEQFPLGDPFDPVIFVNDLARGRSVRLVVSVFAAFFLAVFLAFLLEYIRRVKEDPEESAKIKAAWRGE